MPYRLLETEPRNCCALLCYLDDLFKLYSGDHNDIIHLLQVVEPFVSQITEAPHQESSEPDPKSAYIDLKSMEVVYTNAVRTIVKRASLILPLYDLVRANILSSVYMYGVRTSWRKRYSRRLAARSIRWSCAHFVPQSCFILGPRESRDGTGGDNVVANHDNHSSPVRYNAPLHRP
jgi:hypothetical protein